jgi:predicted dienelactone hydrolase
MNLAQITLLLSDASRNKNLHMRVTCPQSGNGYPVIIWSHGANASKDMYTPLIEYWASHGYVCIQPDHSDSRVHGSGAASDKSRTFRDWQSRPRDVVFILDMLPEIDRLIADAPGKILLTKIGVGGHSFGAHTAQLIGGAEVRSKTTRKYRSYADNRVLAIMLMSPQGSGRESLLDAGSWENMKCPVISITGSHDQSRTGKDWRWRLEPFIYASAHDKYLVYIEGGHHGFGGVVGVHDFPNVGPADSGHVEYVKQASLAFWDAYLKNDDSARAFLHTDTQLANANDDIRIFTSTSCIDEIRNRLGKV